MSNTNPSKVDQVSKYYDATKDLVKVNSVLFWLNALLAIAIYYSTLIIGVKGTEILQIVFLVSVLIYFGISQYLGLYAFPRAGRKRRKQLLANSFGVNLSDDQTVNYYNNNASPSIKRLGANTMENALFSKEIALRMLHQKRLIVAVYLIALIVAFTIRSTDLKLLVIIAQLVFSGEIIVEWLKLEILRNRCEEVYNYLRNYFIQNPSQGTSTEKATILNAFSDYEAAKSEAGVSISSKIYNQINDDLTKEWNEIRKKLNL